MTSARAVRESEPPPDSRAGSPASGTRGRFGLALAGVVAAVYVATVAAYLVPQHLRDGSRPYIDLVWWAMIVRTFRYHVGLALLVAAALAIWWRRRRVAMACVPLLVFSLGPGLGALIPRDEVIPRDRVLRVMSCNVLSSNPDTSGILGEVLRVDPDVVVFQEYSPPWHAAAQRSLATRYPYRATAVRHDPMGQAIYSRLPFVEPVELFVPLGMVDHPQVRAVVRYGDTSVTLYSVHLLPPRSNRLIAAARVQFADLMTRAATEAGPTILLGDFNFTPNGAQAARLRANGYAEAHAEAGWWRGATWPVRGVWRYLPGVRIDQIYASEGLRAVRSRTGVGRSSDHRPVWADLLLEQP